MEYNIHTKFERFLARAKIIHGDRYNYSESIYHNQTTGIKIMCNICKCMFTQTPNTHDSHGCPYCRDNMV